jgi:hypothetical protein
VWWDVLKNKIKKYKRKRMIKRGGNDIEYKRNKLLGNGNVVHFHCQYEVVMTASTVLQAASEARTKKKKVDKKK